MKAAPLALVSALLLISLNSTAAQEDSSSEEPSASSSSSSSSTSSEGSSTEESTETPPEPCGSVGIAYRIGCVAFCNGPPFAQRMVALPVGYSCATIFGPGRCVRFGLLLYCRPNWKSAFLL